MEGSHFPWGVNGVGSISLKLVKTTSKICFVFLMSYAMIVGNTNNVTMP